MEIYQPKPIQETREKGQRDCNRVRLVPEETHTQTLSEGREVCTPYGEGKVREKERKGKEETGREKKKKRKGCKKKKKSQIVKKKKKSQRRDRDARADVDELCTSQMLKGRVYPYEYFCGSNERLCYRVCTLYVVLRVYVRILPVVGRRPRK